MNTQEQTPAVYTGCERAAVALTLKASSRPPFRQLSDEEYAARVSLKSKTIADETGARVMYDALEAIQVILTEDATHCHRIIKGALAAARKGGAL